MAGLRPLALGAMTLISLSVADQECKSETRVGFCMLTGCFEYKHGPAYCDGAECFCKPGYCSVDGVHCISQTTAPTPAPRPSPTPPTPAQGATPAPTPAPTSPPTEAPTTTRAKRNTTGHGGPKLKVPVGVKTALLVIGSHMSQRDLQFLQLGGKKAVWADQVFVDALEKEGYSVTLLRDSEADHSYCELFDIVLVSASIDGNVVKDKLNACSRPAMHWEMGLWLLNGMAGPTMGIDGWCTHANRFARVPKNPTGAWPPLPTGANVEVLKTDSPLVAGLGPGEVPFFEDQTYGMNWARTDRLGAGAVVDAVLPYRTAPFANVSKATLFHYPKGAKLFGDHGNAPALWIGFPPFHYQHGTDPTCEELSVAQQTCKGCSTCVPAAIMEKTVDPMPLTAEGKELLTRAIRMLGEEAQQHPKNAGALELAEDAVDLEHRTLGAHINV